MSPGEVAKYWDDETGFVYYGYRYYDSRTGRWVSRDIIGENGGANLYGLVGNNPVSSVDVDGLRELTMPPPAPPRSRAQNSAKVRPEKTPVRVPIPVAPIIIITEIQDTLDEINRRLDQIQRELDLDMPTEPSWQDVDVRDLVTNRRSRPSLCQKIASRLLGINQYVYSRTSLKRSTGAFAVLWHRQLGKKPGLHRRDGRRRRLSKRLPPGGHT